ncbi:MAG: NTP transferase domain-containing protein [Melioribacteraceae bacterium]|nr:NTP transferase domain-containing protein [Melioribacteraceae bacterium]
MENQSTHKMIKEFSAKFDPSKKNTVIILAAGHGKRIKSRTSKMLHKIWEVPTVERVYNACSEGLSDVNTVIVVGIKAEDVVRTIGKRNSTIFAYQEVQNGTGHAVQVALESLGTDNYDGNVFILPGDMGLLDESTISGFRKDFEESKSDMMVLTGLYEGYAQENYYGRIIRVKETDINGNPSGKDFGKVIEIKENNDIHALNEDEEYKLEYNGRTYLFTKNELININEFNSGVFAFKFKPLFEQINKIDSNNVQGEIYVTDLISIFNSAGLSVNAASPQKQYVIMGFNDKTVLKEMNSIYRKLIYEKIKNIVEVEDPDDFYLHENVVKQIIKMDNEGTPLDIMIGKGSYIGGDVDINYNLEIGRNVKLTGSVKFGKNIVVMDGVNMSTFEGQKIVVGNGTQIYPGNFIKGNVELGENVKVETRVFLTGSTNDPLKIGNNVVLKGNSYIFGSEIGNYVLIEHSVVKRKKIVSGKSFENPVVVRYVFPEAEGSENLKILD